MNTHAEHAHHSIGQASLPEDLLTRFTAVTHYTTKVGKAIKAPNVLATHVNRLHGHYQQTSKHLYTGLGPGDLESHGICLLLQCLKSLYRNLQHLCKDYCIIGKNEDYDLGIADMLCSRFGP